MSFSQPDILFQKCFQAGDIDGAKSILSTATTPPPPSDFRAHPWLRKFVIANDGHCYRKSHLEIAELLIPIAIRNFRDAVLEGRIEDSRLQLRNDPNLVHAEFTAGRGIAQAIHHWQSATMGELLLDAGADIHACTTVHGGDGETPLAMQLRFGTVDGVRLLLNRGADPNRGVSTLMPTKFMEKMIPLLTEYGWRINAGDGRRHTMLHHDANHGHGKRIAVWLKYGADPNIKNQSGQTALHIIAMRGTGRDTIQSLVDAGADMNAVDDNGHTPLDLATSAIRQTAANALISLGARHS